MRTKKARSQKRNTELDFVRGVAILMVISFHALTAPTLPALRVLEIPGRRVGWSGVDLFFVLSGFLVGGVLLKEYKDRGRIDARRFLIRRGFKIWPAYYFYILFQIVVRKHPLNSFLIPNLLHIQNYTGSSLAHTWSLAIEEHFYLMLAGALGWMTYRKWPAARILKTFLITIPVVIGIRCATVFLGGADPASATHTRLDSLLFGVVLATLFHFYPDGFEKVARRKIILMAIVAMTLMFLIVVPPTGIAMRTIGFTILYFGAGAFLLLVYRHSGAMREWRIYRLIARIGLYSYGIYLWHLAVRAPSLWAANHFPEAIRWGALWALQFSTAILLGAALTHAIEWPFLRLRERFYAAKPEDVPVPEVTAERV